MNDSGVSHRFYTGGVIEDRAEFSAATKRLLAERAGYQCSVLNCAKTTIGPGPGGRGVVKTGMAAHIYAARARGPRGTGGLSREELSEPENGIWCCYAHGKAIDSENGGGFSAADLLAWKRLHEARKGAEVLGQPTDRFGLVESIAVRSAPSQLNGREFGLSMRNLIVGPNNSGKSMLARLIASVSYPDHIVEMSRVREIDIAVRWFDPLAHHVTTRGRGGQIQTTLDGRAVRYVPRPFKTVHVPGEGLRSGLTVENLTVMLDLSAQKLRWTLEAMPAHNELVKDVRVGQHTFEAAIELDGRLHRLTSEYPHSLMGVFLTQLAAVHAGYHAEVEPTFLIVDEMIDRGLHPRTAITCMEGLERSAGSAQIAVITHLPALVDHFRAGWPVTALGHPSESAGHPRSHINAEFTTSAPPGSAPLES